MISRYFIPQEHFLINQEKQLSDAITKLRTGNVEQLFVVDDNQQLLGLISPRDLLDQPLDTKILSLMRPCPYLTSEGEIDIYTLIDAILAEQSMKSVPLCDNSKIKKIWSCYDILNKLLKTNLLKGRTIVDLHEKEDSFIVKEEDTIVAAKTCLKQSKTDFVIIVDENSDPINLVTAKLVLEKIYRPKLSIKRKKWSKEKSITAHLGPDEIPISAIAQNAVPEVPSSMKLNTLITEMIKNKSLRVLINDNSKFKGVVTYEKILQFALDQQIILLQYILHKAVRSNFSANKRC